MSSSSFEKVIAILKKYNRFTIGCHLHPDGDAIGSLLALGLSLEMSGKIVEMILPEGEPVTFDFLPGVEKTKRISNLEPEVVISLDCAEKSRLQLPSEVFTSEPLLVNIDHHISNLGFGDVNLVLSDAAATGQIVYELLNLGGFPIDSRIAMSVYTAISTDTGFFRYSNTTGKVLSLASELVNKFNISPSEIAEWVYEEKSFNSVRLLGEVLSTLKISDDNNFSWMVLDQQMLKKYPIEIDEMENYVNYANSVQGVKVGLFFKEIKPGEVKISWRSKATIDVSRLAAHFGGGGHARAAGCSISGLLSEVVKEVLSFVQQYFLQNYEEIKDASK